MTATEWTVTNSPPTASFLSSHFASIRLDNDDAGWRERPSRLSLGAGGYEHDDPSSQEEDDAPFGVSESFHEWLTRVGLRGPLDPDRGGTLVSARQREELQRVWGDAAETETLRRLVENLKDGELEMARMTQAAHERATRELEAETETAWRGRLEAASDAERSAKEELHAREAAVDAAEAEVREERRAARDAAEASDALRSRLEAATRASNVASQRASCLEDELREAKAEVTHAGRALARAKQERDALEQNLRMELASQREGFEQERDAYHKTRDDAAARERVRHNELVERLRSENRDLRAAAASAAERLRLTTRDGADGKAALKQALAPGAVQGICGTPAMRTVLQQKGAIRYDYTFSDGSLAARFDLHEAVCTSFGL